ncbi:MAG TPA: hypothetical protein VM490_21690 [Armatimonadaceae bacterium]|nr:hypothetical protein [Armatimonadaceae bacterium]
MQRIDNQCRRRRTRREFLGGAAAAALLPLAAAGCGGGGGGDDQADVRFITTGGTGILATVAVGPDPGSTFISRVTQFQAAWPDANPPPRFSARILRYEEARAGEPRQVTEQAADVSQIGATTWAIRRRNNFELDQGGVYYIELMTPDGQEDLSAYIVTNDRSQPLPATRAEDVSPGTGGNLSGLTISPAPGSVFIRRNTAFTLAWNGAVPPPSRFTVALRRYEEPRGGEPKNDVEQRITVTRQGNSNAWSVTRSDNFLLDTGGVYYLEVVAPGEVPVRAAYIISADR